MIKPHEFIELSSEEIDAAIEAIQLASGKPSWLPIWFWPRPRFSEICDYCLQRRKT